MTLVQNLTVAGTPGWTVWPATSPKGQYADDANGTEYFLSTITGRWLGDGQSHPVGTKIGLWALTNTESLGSSSPALRLSSRLIDSQTVVPPPSTQKAGSMPLDSCIK